ncbi:MAG: ethanolamine ammonia-lyase reactivating factor EutA [Deltaproteobacteria bacterium]|nr:ethanolamine ammonia-lyase reactivating factor EutA [Deltaproteobacteria bacterium]MDE0035773.1 ethanolamine ammonia-lyase reactivating factor EutA [Deltaproteobacteria bacterium]
MADTGSLGFTGSGRHIVDEDEIKLTSVGVDIGSSTSHLVFSRLELSQEGTRYVVKKRIVLSESEILLTPYTDDLTIDMERLERFINEQYERAELKREDVDTGALILTGVAVRRRNSRAIAELFAEEAGRFVSVTAGDGLETTMAAHGSGAVARSGREEGVVLNIDVGGGTSKIAVCAGGRVREVTAIDVGARLLAMDGGNTVVRIEEAGRRHGGKVGVELELGQSMNEQTLEAIASEMADRLFEVVNQQELTDETRELLRLPPLSYRGKVDAVTFSGGVSEFIYGHAENGYGDMGAILGREIRRRVEGLGVPILEPAARIRATVIGASQYTIQVSGSTIFISPPDAVPVRNVPVVRIDFEWGDDIDPAEVIGAIDNALRRLDLQDGRQPVALAFHWEGSATFARLQGFCGAVAEGLKPILDKGHPLLLVNDGDIGGILGLHFKEEMKLDKPIISVDGIALQEFDYIDVGALIPSSGAVPVVIKSLVFPSAEQNAAIRQ